MEEGTGVLYLMIFISSGVSNQLVKHPRTLPPPAAAVPNSEGLDLHCPPMPRKGQEEAELREDMTERRRGVLLPMMVTRINMIATSTTARPHHRKCWSKWINNPSDLTIV